jgi:hypothetical protein
VVIDLDHVLASERRGGTRLVFEAPARFGAFSVLGVDEFHRNARPERRVDALPNRAHPASTEHAREPILARDDRRGHDGRRAVGLHLGQ